MKHGIKMLFLFILVSVVYGCSPFRFVRSCSSIDDLNLKRLKEYVITHQLRLGMTQEDFYARVKTDRIYTRGNVHYDLWPSKKQGWWGRAATRDADGNRLQWVRIKKYWKEQETDEHIDIMYKTHIIGVFTFREGILSMLWYYHSPYPCPSYWAPFYFDNELDELLDPEGRKLSHPQWQQLEDID